MLDLNIKNFEQHFLAKQQKHNDIFCYILEKCKKKMEVGLSRGHERNLLRGPRILDRQTLIQTE